MEHSIVLLKTSLDGVASIDHADFVSLYGLKAGGLRLIPGHWTPPYFLISHELYKKYRNLGVDARNTNPSDIYSREDLEALRYGLSSVTDNTNGHVLVRSSAIQESINDRGRYNSIVCRGEINELAIKILELYHSVANCETTIMGLVVQKYIEPIRIQGHLSNERRLSYQRATWWYEYESKVGSSKHEKLTARQVAIQANEGTHIICRTEKDLRNQIRTTANWALRNKSRTHYEWVWDGMYLWIVQQDFEPEPSMSAYATSKPTAKKVGQAHNHVYQILKDEESIESGIWKKLDSVKVFRKCSLPVVKLWILNDIKTFEKILLGKVPRSLNDDLAKLLEQPIVIRTDLQSIGEVICGYMLPRSSTVYCPEDAINFIRNVIKKLNDEGESIERLCFVFHHYIPSRSSAICLASPGNEKVRIDSIWGLPDGLQFLPHDSYELNGYGHSSIKRYRRYKEECLDLDQMGRWITRRVKEALIKTA